MTRRRPRPARHHHVWTDAEDAVLLRDWNDLGARALLRLLPGRAWSAIYEHATRELHLPRGLPQGRVSLKEAARRLGYARVSAVRGLARRQRVALRRPPHPTTLAPRARPQMNVDWEAIRAAYLREANGTETIAEAARRKGLCDVRLGQWLREAGLTGESHRGMPRRIPVAEVDRVVEERRAA